MNGERVLEKSGSFGFLSFGSCVGKTKYTILLVVFLDYISLIFAMSSVI